MVLGDPGGFFVAAMEEEILGEELSFIERVG
jgi:hypothetical protein